MTPLPGTAEPLRVRRWLVITALIALAAVVAISWQTPSAILLALIPLSYTIPLFVWLDRLEPEPRAMRWNAFLWGAGISVLVASFFNDLTSAAAGMAVAAVVSAPISEEIMKILGISSAAKRRQIDGPLDGAVYAGYVGLGFAAVENVIYFSDAINEDVLGSTFVLRGLFSPLAHPYFCMWAGIAVGRAVQRGRSRRVAAVRGLLVAIPLHATWNLGAVSPIFSVLLLGHIVLFVVLVRRIRRLRRAEVALVRERLPQLAFQYNLSPAELEIYGNLRATARLRRQMTREQKRAFDRRRVAVTKAALRA
ncbi:MAG: protease PrsW [Actinobacteria bacterium]|nr:protease PrsW [Actinomycetota bacterium]